MASRVLTLSALQYTIVVVVVLVAASDAQQLQHRQLLEQLCNQDAAAPQVTQLVDLANVITVLKTDRSVRCPLRFAETLLELEFMTRLHSVCSEEAADLLVDYWFKYVNEKSELSANLHPTLKTLFVAYGLQVSKLCKLNLMQELPAAIHQMRITEQDVHSVTGSIEGNRKLAKIFGDEPKLEDLLIVVRTDSARSTRMSGEQANEELSRISMPPRERQQFELMREKCLLKFKPVYDELISPIVRLTSIGLNYKEESLLASLDAFKAQSRIYKDWFNVIVACEAIVRHEPISLPQASLQQASGAASATAAAITVLDPDDMAELRARTGVATASASASAAASFEAAIYANERSNNYRVQVVRMYNQVLDPSDQYLLRTISRYGRGLEEATKLRVRLIKRLPSIMKLVFKSKEVQFGLHPLEEQQKSRHRMSRKTKKRLTVIGLGLLLITGVAVSTATLVALAWPLAKVWLAVGGCIIFIILIGMIFGVVRAKE